MASIVSRNRTFSVIVHSKIVAHLISVNLINLGELRTNLGAALRSSSSSFIKLDVRRQIVTDQ